MAVDSYDATTGRPIFLDSGAPDIGVDPTAVGIYAAEVGNRIVKANLAALNSYAYKRAGLKGHALDTKFDYLYDGSGWVRVATVKAVASGSVACPASGGSGVSPVFFSDLIDVTFPTGLFSSAPQVTVQTVGPSGQVPFGGVVEQITTTGCKVRGMRVSAVPATGFSVLWVAVQS